MPSTLTEADHHATTVLKQRIHEWGVETVEFGASTLQPFGFAGGIRMAATALWHFGARNYSPAIGQWVEKDPIEYAGGTGPYLYCENDPVNRIDPTGLVWGAVIGGTVAGVIAYGQGARGGDLAVSIGIGVAMGAISPFLIARTEATAFAAGGAVLFGETMFNFAAANGIASGVQYCATTDDFDSGDLAWSVGVGFVAGGIGGLLSGSLAGAGSGAAGNARPPLAGFQAGSRIPQPLADSLNQSWSQRSAGPAGQTVAEIGSELIVGSIGSIPPDRD
ncbi:MAG: RHS repeat-associated core domain-containing protein [Deltaproteobacteria bacterium]|jgi:RHS repeat-associated protein